MNWDDWKPLYMDIVAELGIDPARDMESAMLLRHLTSHLPDGTAEAERVIRGRDVVVIGPAIADTVPREGATLISAGSATSAAIRRNIWPDIIVTDLDGEVADQVEANGMGAIAVLHAHGDNKGALREWAPEFNEPIICTTQARPFEGMQNFGGFTDGDRAVFLALHFGARSVSLEGFDLDNPQPKPGTDIRRKARKLAIAARLIAHARLTHPREMASP